VSTSGTQRSYSIWAVLGVFVVIGLVGLVGLFLVGSPRTPTVQLSGNQRLVDRADPGQADADQAATDQTDALPADEPAVSEPSPVTVPGGAAAPVGVSDVLRAEDSTSFTFDVPPEIASAATVTAVPPVRVAYSADGTAVVVGVSCAVSSAEVLALLSVTETASSVTVLPVVLVPDGGPPCDGAAPPREVIVPLASPAAGRSLTVVPAGTAVPGFTSN